MTGHMSDVFQLAGYEILGKIGDGGMSTVWKARQLSLDRLVAIKTLAPAYLPDEEAWRRFRLEAKAAARLSHPGIVQVFDAGESSGLPYIVMEYVDGRSLADILAEHGRLPEQDSLVVADAVAQALGYAWDKDCIIHCDVKPDNILVASDGAVKVVDLGLARFIGIHRRSSDGDMIVGTPNYTAPEQAEGAPDLDCRVDIYSLGATLYHLVTGKLPFAGSPGSSAMDRHMHEFLPDPLELDPSLQPATAWLIEKMMVKDRAYRPAYWSEVLLDLAEVRAGRMPRPPLPEPGQSTVSRSARRVQAEPEKEPESPALRIAQKKKFVLKPSEKAGSAAPSPMRAPAYSRPEPGMRAALFQTLVLSVVAVAVYAFFFSGTARRIRLRPAAPPASPAERATPEAPRAPEENAAADVDWRVESAPAAPARASSAATWRDETFVRGARAFNEAIALYKDYQATRSDPSVLKRVETLAREAANAFEACRDRAPAEVGIDGHIRTAYHLLADVRQSTLVDNARPIADAVHQEEQALPAPTSSLAPRERPTAPQSGGLTLSPVWNKMPLGRRELWEDLRKLLSEHGQPGVDLNPAPQLQLVGQIYYLMPAAAAAQALGATLGARRPLETPGFPDRSFGFYALRGDFGEGFDQAALVVDAADRVAAVQLSREKPMPLSLDVNAFSLDWRAHNFVAGKIKGRREWRIAHAVRAQNGVVVVDTELAEPDPFQVYGLGRSKERVTLYLPQQVVNLILARLENAN